MYVCMCMCVCARVCVVCVLRARVLCACVCNVYLVVNDLLEVDSKVSVEEDKRDEGAPRHDQPVTVGHKTLDVDL
jgi:hypothetical protein